MSIMNIPAFAWTVTQSVLLATFVIFTIFFMLWFITFVYNIFTHWEDINEYLRMRSDTPTSKRVRKCKNKR